MRVKSIIPLNGHLVYRSIQNNRCFGVTLTYDGTKSPLLIAILKVVSVRAATVLVNTKIRTEGIFLLSNA